MIKKYCITDEMLKQELLTRSAIMEKRDLVEEKAWGLIQAGYTVLSITRRVVTRTRVHFMGLLEETNYYGYEITVDTVGSSQRRLPPIKEVNEAIAKPASKGTPNTATAPAS